MFYKDSLSLSSDRAFLVLSEPIRIMASHLELNGIISREQTLSLSLDQDATPVADLELLKGRIHIVKSAREAREKF